MAGELKRHPRASIESLIPALSCRRGVTMDKRRIAEAVQVPTETEGLSRRASGRGGPVGAGFLLAHGN
jgi:hypothetical protein